MKKTSKYLIVSAVTAALMIVFSLLLIAYDKGLFDLSFIKRPEPAVTEPSGTSATAEHTDTEEPGTDPADETTEPDGTDTDAPGPEPGIFDILHETYPLGIAEGYSPTELTYDPAVMKIFRVALPVIPQKTDEIYVMTRTRYSVKTEKNLRTITEYESSEPRMPVDVYMGMAVVCDGGKLTFCDGTGKTVFTYEGEEELVFAYERDLEDRPLFRIGEQYYIIEDGGLKESDYDKRDSRGLYFNYPSYFGKKEGEFRVFRSGSLYGIKDTDGDNLRSAIYKEAYNYSDGLGLVNFPITKKGVLTDDYNYLNEKGKVVIENFDPVVIRDEGGIGSIYFDGGYVLIRKIKRDIRDNVIEDDEVLIDKKGAEFDMPEGYKLVSYSDQRILVKKDGKYGFYAVKGAWIADAVYDSASPYYEGLAVVAKGGKYGVIDLEGNFVIPLSYDHISVCSGGIMICRSAETGYEMYVKTAA